MLLKLFTSILTAFLAALFVSQASWALTIGAGATFNPTSLNCDPANTCSFPNSAGQYVISPLDNNGTLSVATGDGVNLPSATSDNGAGVISLHAGSTLEVSGPISGHTVYFATPVEGGTLIVDPGGPYANGTVVANWNDAAAIEINGASIPVGPFVVASQPVNNMTVVSWMGMSPGVNGIQVLVSIDHGAYSEFGCTALANVLGQEQATWLQHGHTYTFALAPSNGCTPQTTQSPIASVSISD